MDREDILKSEKLNKFKELKEAGILDNSDKQNFFLGLCGCVDKELANDMISVLKETGKKEFYIDKICERTGFEYKYVLCILCWLDDKELIEHGTAIRGSWITEKGKILLSNNKKVV